MKETTGLENEFEYDSAELLDLIANMSGGKDEDYPNRPGTGGDNIHMLDAEGNYINPNAPGADVVAGKYAEWLEEAEAYGVENLTARDQVLYAQAGYRSGKLTADEAQEIYDPAYAQSMEDFGYKYDEERGQWYDEGRLNDTIDGGEKGVKDWYTAIDFSNANTGFEDFGGDYINSEWDVDREIINTSFISNNFKMGLAVGAALITGGAASAYLGTLGMGTIGAGAASGAIGSAVSGAVMGDITLEGLVTGAIMGGIGGWADTLQGMEGAIMDSSVLGATDDFINTTADLLRVDYDTALSIVEGVAKGAVSGGELQDIVAGAVAGWGVEKTQDFLQGIYGDTVNVQDWFKDGQSNIPIEALDPFIEGAWNAALTGEGDMGDLAKMLWDYHREGGDLDFLLPPGVDVGGDVLGWIDQQLPDVTINWDAPEFDVTWAEGLGPEDGFEEDERDKVTIDIGTPDIDIDLPPINLPDVSVEKGNEWAVETDEDGKTVVTWAPVEPPDWVSDIPGVNIDKGDEWGATTDEDGNINITWAPIDIPDVDLDGEVPELPDVVECMEGWQWDDLLGQCVKIPDVPEVPDVVECMEGWQWDDLTKKCVKLPEFGSDDETSDEIEGEGLDGEIPEIPDVPSVASEPTQASQQSAQGLFDYINISPQEAAKLTPFVDYVQQARGMLS